MIAMTAGQVKTYSISVAGEDARLLAMWLENAPEGAATIVLTELSTGRTWNSYWEPEGFVGERVISDVVVPGEFTATITAQTAFAAIPLSLEIYG